MVAYIRFFFTSLMFANFDVNNACIRQLSLIDK